MIYQNCKVTDETKNGDFAVLARIDADSPWVQVEATKGGHGAMVYAAFLDGDEDGRINQIDDAEQGGIDFGDSTPVEALTATA